VVNKRVSARQLTVITPGCSMEASSFGIEVIEIETPLDVNFLRHQAYERLVPESEYKCWQDAHPHEKQNIVFYQQGE
jgi:hypothetical protein